MPLDIRLPIGLLFTIFGLILLIAGAMSDPSAYARSLGINMNLCWGAVMLATGLVLLYFGRRTRPNA